MSEKIVSIYHQFARQVTQQCTIDDYREWCRKKQGFQPTNYDCLVVTSLFQHDDQFLSKFHYGKSGQVERIFKKIS